MIEIGSAEQIADALAEQLSAAELMELAELLMERADSKVEA
ncbi:hypothetical protein [Streptomyces sp. SID12488]|nr:hypothetical protein [Streptomyces sp. SID12488]